MLLTEKMQRFQNPFEEIKTFDIVKVKSLPFLRFLVFDGCKHFYFKIFLQHFPYKVPSVLNALQKLIFFDIKSDYRKKKLKNNYTLHCTQNLKMKNM